MGEIYDIDVEAQLEELRGRCEIHGPYYSDWAAKAIDLGRYMQGGFSDDDIERYAADNGMQDVLGSIRAIETTAVAFQVTFEPSIWKLFADGKTSAVIPLAERLVDEFVKNLGHPPNTFEIIAAMNELIMIVADQTRRVTWGVENELYLPVKIDQRGKITAQPVPSDIDSGLIHQFTAYCLAVSDKSLLCMSESPIGENSVVETNLAQISDQLIAQFNIRNPIFGYLTPLQAGFVKTKYRNLFSLSSMTRWIHECMPLMQTAPEVTAEELRHWAEQNTRLTKQIQKIRKHGIASIVFPTDELIPGTEAVYEDFSKADSGLMGEHPLAYVRLVSAQNTEAEKFQFEPKVLTDDKDFGMITATGYFVLSIDHNGELFVGTAPQTNSIPMRRLFMSKNVQIPLEVSGVDPLQVQYEHLRTVLLSHLFDSILPATIVNEIHAQAPQPRAEIQLHDPTDIVTRMLLPRIRYLESKKSREITNEIKLATQNEQDSIRAELEQQAADGEFISSKRLHEVPAFTRPLPKHSRGPSERAKRLSKECFGEDYELPPGRTFVKKHDRGDLRNGRVIGRAASEVVAKTVTLTADMLSV